MVAVGGAAAGGKILAIRGIRENADQGGVDFVGTIQRNENYAGVGRALSQSNLDSTRGETATTIGIFVSEGNASAETRRRLLRRFARHQAADSPGVYCTPGETVFHRGHGCVIELPGGV